MSQTHSNRETGLDALRGLAALGVGVFHLGNLCHYLAPSVPTFETGRYGVQLFFTISGYVILMTAYNSRNRSSFIKARILRLYPGFLICLCLTTTLILACRYPLSLETFALNLTMIPQAFGAASLDNVYWTLGYEIGFYAIVSILLPVIQRGNALYLSAIFLIILPSLPIDFELCSFFTTGIAIFEYRKSPLLSIVILVSSMILGNHVDYTITVPIMVIVSTMIRIPKMLAFQAGAISYPFYLIHNTFSRGLLLAFQIFGLFTAFILSLLITILVSYLIVRYLERPLIAFLKGNKNAADQLRTAASFT